MLPGIRGSLVAGAFLALAGSSALEAQPELFPTLSVRAGGFAVTNGTNLRLDADHRARRQTGFALHKGDTGQIGMEDGVDMFQERVDDLLQIQSLRQGLSGSAESLGRLTGG